MNNIHRLEHNFRSNLTNIRNDYQRLFENYEYHNQSKIRGYLKLLEIDKQDILEIEQQNQLVRNYRVSSFIYADVKIKISLFININ